MGDAAPSKRKAQAPRVHRKGSAGARPKDADLIDEIELGTRPLRGVVVKKVRDDVKPEVRVNFLVEAKVDEYKVLTNVKAASGEIDELVRTSIPADA